MNYTSEQIVQGIIAYADTEVIHKLPTSGKWIVGTTLMLASSKVPEVVEYIRHNALAKMLGIVDEEGNMDATALLAAMKQAAEKYGSMTLCFPFVGTMTFSHDDIDRLKTYIG